MDSPRKMGLGEVSNWVIQGGWMGVASLPERFNQDTNLEYWVGVHSHNEIEFRNGFPSKNGSGRGL